MTSNIRKVFALPLALALGIAMAPALAQQQQRGGQGGQNAQGGQTAPGAAEGLQLPAPQSTHHSVALPGRTLNYTAKIGAIDLRDTEGRLRAEIVVTSYVLDGQDPATRPVAFAFNGGPGASSAFLDLVGLGPERLAGVGNQGDGPSATPVLTPNAETWLDFTDLVFIDPPGTGFSRIAGGNDVARQTYAVDGDIAGISRTIARWLAENGRLASPKALVGESYGGFRVPKVAHRLATGEGVGVRTLIMLSPVLDFALLNQSPSPVAAPVAAAARLPALAATAMEKAGKAPTRADLASIEAYAFGDYLTDYVRGPKDDAAAARMTAKVAELSGLDPAFVARSKGRIDTNAFLRELYRGTASVASSYDGAVTGLDPYPNAVRTSFEDPVLDAMRAPLTAAAVAHTRDNLNWKPTGRYEVLNNDVNRQWDWGRGLNPPESASDLREMLAFDPKLKALVVHGLGDFVTPYMASRYILDQMPAIGDPKRLGLSVYPGGHMFYTRDASRKAFRADAAALFGADAP